MWLVTLSLSRQLVPISWAPLSQHDSSEEHIHTNKGDLKCQLCSKHWYNNLIPRSWWGCRSPCSWPLTPLLAPSSPTWDQSSSLCSGLMQRRRSLRTLPTSWNLLVGFIFIYETGIHVHFFMIYFCRYDAGTFRTLWCDINYNWTCIILHIHIHNIQTKIFTKSVCRKRKAWKLE